MVEQGLGSLRGAVGTPEQIRELLEGYEAAGVDQVIFVSQAGRNRHEHICESLELFASRGHARVPRGRAPSARRRKLERLGEAMESALARRQPPQEMPEGYHVQAMPAP